MDLRRMCIVVPDGDGARQGVERVVHGLFGLRTAGSPMVKMPVDGVEVLPRSKPVKLQREQTRWEKFAAAKGIRKRPKRERMVWDEESREFRPRFGYRRANPQKTVPVATVASGGKYQPKAGLDKGLKVAQRSTASAGRFDERVDKEPARKARGQVRARGKVTAVADRAALKAERKQALGLVERVLTADPPNAKPAVKKPSKRAKTQDRTAGAKKRKR
mmetsp:Transcript_16361/g.33310  ORF Transcript_16361/g.33310 Transcript_16361/m.33310 type:complete len:218 (-) Transcript_16361:4580-5233(-)